jgi:hypothetical protein
MLLCVHNKVEKFCDDCGGCEHGLFKINCKTCNPEYRPTPQSEKQKIFCEHDKRHDNCLKCCNPDMVCEHGKFKRSCRECVADGVAPAKSMICYHLKLKQHCKLCGNPDLWCALHDKEKRRCVKCSAQAVPGHEEEL